MPPSSALTSTSLTRAFLISQAVAVPLSGVLGWDNPRLEMPCLLASCNAIGQKAREGGWDKRPGRLLPLSSLAGIVLSVDSLRKARECCADDVTSMEICQMCVVSLLI